MYSEKIRRMERAVFKKMQQKCHSVKSRRILIRWRMAIAQFRCDVENVHRLEGILIRKFGLA